METKDHLHLAKLITSESAFGDRLSKAAFEYGCIAPDVNPLTYIKGHKYSSTIENVKGVIEKLHGRLKTPSDYFNLGRAVHFIGDYFTFPHSPLFKGTLSEHRSYEHRLHEFIKTHGSSLGNIINGNAASAQKCIQLLERAQEKYNTIRHSIENDWLYIRYACANIALSAAKYKFSIPKSKIILQENGI